MSIPKLQQGAKHHRLGVNNKPSSTSFGPSPFSAVAPLPANAEARAPTSDKMPQIAVVAVRDSDIKSSRTNSKVVTTSLLPVVITPRTFRTTTGAARATRAFSVEIPEKTPSSQVCIHTRRLTYPSNGRLPKRVAKFRTL